MPEKVVPFNSIVCPISAEKVDSNTSRITVFLNVMFLAVFVVTRQPAFAFIVAVDYCIRAFFDARYSPIRIVSSGIVRLLRLQMKQVNLAPKVFASRLGFLCAAAAFVLSMVAFPTSSLVIAGLLLVLGFMDSVFNLCVGCMIYNYLVFPFFETRQV